MKKKISYLIIFLIALICFNKQASALDCEYTRDLLNLKFTINDDGSISGGEATLSMNFNGLELNPKISIDNWDAFSKNFYESNKECPPYVIIITKTSIKGYVANSEILETGILSTLDLDDIDNVHKLELVGFKHDNEINHPVNFIITYDPNGGSGMPKTYPVDLTKTNLEDHALDDITFERNGYIHSGWLVHTGYGWLCKSDNGEQKYDPNCSENDRIVIKKGANFDFYIKAQDGIEFLAKWDISSNIVPTIINSSNLGENVCKNNNYVWNKEGYCNTDNLQYVMCGDAHDIPAQIPSLISMAVNLLKIATPIVLIIVSIITLVKAIMSSKEDEIKKGQQSLIRKVIAAIMIFMIISMVQFVVLKVADDKDQTSISSCMSCFLNNDCTANKYFKTNVKGNYYCSKVSDKGKNSELCDSFYDSNNKSNNSSTTSEFNCYVGDYIITFSTKYNEEGYPISATTKSGKEVKPDFGTDFYPKNSSECPTDSNAIADIKDGTLWILKKN